MRSLGRQLARQVRRNLVAIISLILAASSLSYNTWRNELTEQNRNYREAGFELIVTLGELQEIVFLAHFDPALQEGNPRAGWVRVLILQDLAEIMPTRVDQATQRLLSVWTDNWARLGTDAMAEESISSAIENVRNATLTSLQELE